MSNCKSYKEDFRRVALCVREIKRQTQALLWHMDEQVRHPESSLELNLAWVNISVSLQVRCQSGTLVNQTGRNNTAFQLPFQVPELPFLSEMLTVGNNAMQLTPAHVLCVKNSQKFGWGTVVCTMARQRTLLLRPLGKQFFFHHVICQTVQLQTIQIF